MHQPANDNHAFARELWETVRYLERINKKMHQTIKIKKRESDYEAIMIRGDQELMKFYGTEPSLIVLGEVWANDKSCRETIRAAARMGLKTDHGDL